jgi:hypothetical protein
MEWGCGSHWLQNLISLCRINNRFKKPSTTNSKLIKNLLPGTLYKWAVQSICASGPLVASSYLTGPDFTTDPYKMGEEVNASYDMEIFPNPASASSTISISLKDAPGNEAMVEILDAVGRYDE